jgi:phosphocarrier protein
MVKHKVIIKNKLGLHARPASLFVQAANQFDSEVYVQKDDISVNAKSIMGVMILGVGQGDEIELEINGEDEESAAETLIQLIDSKFDNIDER